MNGSLKACRCSQKHKPSTHVARVWSKKQDRTLSQPPHHCDLSAIAKARSWIDDIRLGHLASFLEIAEREGQGERHIREWRLNPQQQALSEIGASSATGLLRWFWSA